MKMVEITPVPRGVQQAEAGDRAGQEDRQGAQHRDGD